MIDLSNAKVGDWYLDANENKLECVFIASSCDFRYVFTDTEHGGFTGIYNSKGKNNSHCCVDIVSKIDPRPWLKDMPDAGVFADRFKWLACDRAGKWLFHETKAGRSGREVWLSSYPAASLDAIKMPTLTGGQWKDSLISIEELREWQEVNK